MKAIRFERYGSPDVLTLADIEVPVPAADQVLVKVAAASVNALDWHLLRGKPYLVRLAGGLRAPREHGIGADVAGTVVSVGANVTDFAPGDEVFGQSIRTFAEYVVVSKTGLVAKPARLSMDQAAALPVAGLTALQGLRKGGLTRGQRVLITGASGGVGHFAVQVAAASGAVVTASCRTRHVAMVESLGASTVLDYTRVDVTRGQYDLVLDAAGSLTVRQLKRLAPMAVIAGAPSGDWIAPVIGPIVAATSSRLVSYLQQRSLDDLTEIGTLVTPVIDSRFALAEVPDAIRHIESGHPGGKIVITVDE